MKTDFASLKKEFARLTDVGALKKELNRLAAEIRKFDLSAAIPPAQRQRVEKRYRTLTSAVSDLQKRVDLSFARVSSFVRKSSKKKMATAKKTSRKQAPKTNPKGTATRKKVSKKVRSKSSGRASAKSASK